MVQSLNSLITVVVSFLIFLGWFLERWSYKTLVQWFSNCVSRHTCPVVFKTVPWVLKYAAISLILDSKWPKVCRELNKFEKTCISALRDYKVCYSLKKITEFQNISSLATQTTNSELPYSLLLSKQSIHIFGTILMHNLTCLLCFITLRWSWHIK